MTTIHVEPETHERLKALGAKDETFDQIITRLLTEQPYATELQQVLNKTIEAIEEGKKRGVLPVTACDELVSTVQRFIVYVEKR